MSTESKIAAALHQAQYLMGGAEKDSSNPHWNSSYSSLTSVLNAVMPAFYACDIALTQVMEVTEGGRMLLVTKLIHTSGEEIVSKMVLPVVNKPQELGSNITYFKRYSLMAIAAVPSVDDDGSAADKQSKVEEYIKEKTENENISPLHLQKLKNHDNFCPEFESDVLSKLKIKDLSEIKNIHFEEVVKHVRKWKSKENTTDK